MTVRSTLAAVAIASLALGACAKEAAGAQGPVVAVVNGEKITVDDLKAEGGPNAAVTDPGILQRIIDRKLLAKALATAKAENPGELEASVERAGDAAKADAYARTALASLKAPTAEELQAYVAANPNAFANRRFFVVDQIELKRTDRPVDLPTPVASLEQLQAALDAKQALYQRTVAAVDSASSRPEVVDRLESMGAGAVFEMGDAANLVMGRVVAIRPAPLTGPMAQAIAANLLRNTASGKAMTDTIAGLRKSAKIEYQAGYEPPKP